MIIFIILNFVYKNNINLLETYAPKDLNLYLSFKVNTFYPYWINLYLSKGAVTVLVKVDIIPVEPKYAKNYLVAVSYY